MVCTIPASAWTWLVRPRKASAVITNDAGLVLAVRRASVGGIIPWRLNPTISRKPFILRRHTMADASSFLPLVSSLLILLFLLFASLSWRWTRSVRKNLPPSPPSFPIIGHLHLIAKLPPHRALAAIAAARGPVVLLRLGSRPVLLVSSAVAAEECFTTHDVTFANRPRLLPVQIMGYGCTSIASSSYGPHWRNLRRISAVHLLSTGALRSSSDSRTGAVRSLAKALFLEESDSGPPGPRRVEMKSRFFNLAYDVMMGVVATDVEGESADERRRFQEVVEETFAVSGAVNVADFFPALRRLGWRGQERKLVRIQRSRDALIGELIERHRLRRRQSGSNGEAVTAIGNGDKGRATVIDVMLSLQESDPGTYTDVTIKGLIVVRLVSSLFLILRLRSSPRFDSRLKCTDGRRAVIEAGLHPSPQVSCDVKLLYCF
ncbi:hypothetical protein BHE74_00035113 [Ensete ventricosum]|nr:hypothetical protein BHE74_00035113 [Ensete ventricosum]